MTFSIAELLFSVALALLFGICFCAFIIILDILIGAFSLIPGFFSMIISFDKLLPTPRLINVQTNRQKGPLYIFLSVLIFALGFSLLSYVSLDGEIRIYMLALAFASFYLSKFAFCDFLTKIFLQLFSAGLSLVALLLGWMILPIKLAVGFVKKAQNK